MLIVGADEAVGVATGTAHSAKMVFNQRGAIFFPIAHQHRDTKAEGISYEDDYRGNALAAMISPGQIEVRYHSAFTDRDVVRVLQALMEMPELAMIRDWRV